MTRFSLERNGRGDQIVQNIKRIFPSLKIMFMGSTALEIAGQKDIDIYILADHRDFGGYLPGLEKLFGKIDKQGGYVNKKFIEWKFNQDGYQIEIYLTEPPERQIQVYEILKSI